jgi:hypothetical protein
MKTELNVTEYVARLNAPWYRRIINKLLGRW